MSHLTSSNIVPTNIVRLVPMPLERSDAIPNLSDPNIVLGPRKRRPTERLLENGDPLVCKKARRNSNKEKHTLPSMPPPTHPMHTVPNPRWATLSSESMLPLTHPLCTTPNRQAIDHTESSDDGTSDGAQAIVVEDSDDMNNDWGSDEGETTDEDDDAELGM